MKKAVSIPKLKAKCQLVCNEYIRLRDKDQPCISCGLPKNLQAGHYYPTQGYDGLRFDEFNIHGECSGCNCFDSGHLIGYGDNLLNRIGTVNFGILKLRASDYKKNGHKWSRTELQEKIKYFQDKIKELS
jgi:hypothetical protein